MADLVYKETCCCGGSIEITTEVPHIYRNDRANEFVRKHKKCTEIWATTFVSMPMAVSSRAIDPDEAHLSQDERDRYGIRARKFPHDQLVMSFSSVEALLLDRAAKNRR